jgi:hypothetical protein
MPAALLPAAPPRAVRAPLALSTLPALNVEFPATLGGSIWLRCPICRQLAEAPRDRVQDHVLDDGAWCAGSGRQLLVDLTAAQHAARQAAARAARLRHAGLRPHTRSGAPVSSAGAPRPVVRRAPARTAMAVALSRAYAAKAPAPASVMV